MKNNSIFSISPFPAGPFTHGSIIRIHQLNQAWGKRYPLFFSCRKNNYFPNEKGFGGKIFSTGVTRIEQLFSPFFLLKAARFIRKQRVGIILSNHLWSGLNGIFLKMLTGRPLVFDNHNVEYIRFRRLGRFFWPAVWMLEKIVCTVADRVLCVSPVDRETLIKGLGVSPEKIHVAENGVDIVSARGFRTDCTGFRKAMGVGKGEYLFLFFGNFDYPPNFTAAWHIMDEIVPRLKESQKRARIAYVGAGSCPARTRRDGNISQNVHGFVQDVKPFIQCADVMIAPITEGSGTRLKILESIAMGTPVVTTTIGAEGIDASVCGDKLAILDDWADFTSRALSLADTPRTGCPPEFCEKYDWSCIAAKVPLFSEGGGNKDE